MLEIGLGKNVNTMSYATILTTMIQNKVNAFKRSLFTM